LGQYKIYKIKKRKDMRRNETCRNYRKDAEERDMRRNDRGEKNRKVKW
jgi:hypothetical protein